MAGISDPAILVRRADLMDQQDAHAYLQQLSAYAADPMGAGSPLPGHIGRSVLNDLRRNPAALCMLAAYGDESVGFATCFIGYSTFRARPLLNVHDIAVLPAWRGRGVGRALLGAITDVAQELGCCRLTLEVRSDNPAAESLYRSVGFHNADCDLFLHKPL